jgi:predicted RNA-binding Zn-ribbon protein involved in translation (DUF1610 family)
MGPFFLRTGQGWKIYVAHALLMGACGIAALRWLVLGRNRLEFAQFIAGAGWLLWVNLVLWCPRCGAAIIWRTLSSRPLGAAIKSIFAVSSCPVCGYEGDEPNVTR